jgi:hypothetical protein
MTTPTGQIRTPGSRTDADVLEVIEDRLGRGRTPRQIYGELTANPRFAGRVPSIKTMWRKAKTFHPPTAEERWSLREADPEEAAVVLPVFAAMAKRDRVWQCKFITKEQAQILVRVNAAAPDLDPWVAFKVAEEYRVRQSRGESTVGLELGLTLAPWRDEASAGEFRRLLDVGFLTPELSRDARFVERESKEARRFDPIMDAINRREERAIEAAEDYWGSLTEEEEEAEMEQQHEAAVDLGLE